MYPSTGNLKNSDNLNCTSTEKAIKIYTTTTENADHLSAHPSWGQHLQIYITSLLQFKTSTYLHVPTWMDPKLRWPDLQIRLLPFWIYPIMTSWPVGAVYCVSHCTVNWTCSLIRCLTQWGLDIASPPNYFSISSSKSSALSIVSSHQLLSWQQLYRPDFICMCQLH